MFTPFRNFITYIQKNTSGSGIFGTGGTSAQTLPIEKEPKEMLEETNGITKTAETTAKITNMVATTTVPFVNSNIIKKDIKKLNIKKEHIIPITLLDNKIYGKRENAEKLSIANDIHSKKLNNLFNADDDIEFQIKSSIMVKPAAVNEKKSENPTTPFNNDIRRMSILRRPSISMQSMNTKVEHTQFMPPKHLGRMLETVRMAKSSIIPSAVIRPIAPMAPITPSAPVQVEPEKNESGFNNNFEIALHEVNNKDFLDISLPEIPNSEIIVLNCVESILSPVSPSVDPLALDQALNTCTTSTSSCDIAESVETHEYWLGTNEVHSMSTAEGAVCYNQGISEIQSSNEQQAEEIRSEGSDSGLGTEAQTAKLQELYTSRTTDNVIINTKVKSNLDDANSIALSSASTSTITLPFESTFAILQPLRSNLKRRSDTNTIDREHKRLKRTINFDSVKVYYFQRQQGFSCVPSAGGCTLGMAAEHIGFKSMSLAEHAAELRRAHRLQLQEINARGSSSDDSEESEEDFLSEGSGSDLDAETNGFLQPVSPKQRRALLKAAGVRKIDASEKIECRDIRNSREICGCSCRDFCDPETCSCSQSGIKCQVDRTMFPCGCSREACGNTVGRVEFNPARVRTHFIHTIMRLEMENRQQQPHMPMNNNNNGNINNYNMSPNHFYNQPQGQSNYSSGYASPAYNNETIGSQSPSSYYVPQNHYVSSSYGVDNFDNSNNIYTNNGGTHNYNETHSTALGPSYNNSNYQVINSRPVSETK